MNIFVLDLNIKLCSQYHCDQHCRKMIIEYAQMLSTAHRLLDGGKMQSIKNNRKYSTYVLQDDRESVLYKSTHINHPSSIWARQSSENYLWLYSLFIELSQEFFRRYGKHHATFLKLKDVLSVLPNNITKDSLTSIPQCMPDQFKNESVVEAYRNFYILDKAQKFKVTWTNREIPRWFL